LPNSPTHPFTKTTSAIFVGSFVTDAAANIVAFHRNGEEVIVTKSDAVVGNTFDTGIWAPATHTFSPPVPAAALTWAVALPAWYPTSAASAIVDVFLTNASHDHVDPNNPGVTVKGAAQKISFLDPNAANPPPAPAPIEEYVIIAPQLEPPAPALAITSTESVRLRLNTSSANPSLLVYQPSTTDQTAIVTVDISLRGYVEPRRSLCPR
jgi:hypothetical protein